MLREEPSPAHVMVEHARATILLIPGGITVEVIADRIREKSSLPSKDCFAC
jgi:hypothetical protein